MFDKIKTFTGWNKETIHAWMIARSSQIAMNDILEKPQNECDFDGISGSLMKVGVLEPEYFVGIPEKNTFISMEEWIETTSPAKMYYGKSNFECRNVCYRYFGYPVIDIAGGVVVFVLCEYCGSKDHKYNMNLLDEPCCSHCSAPIWRSL